MSIEVLMLPVVGVELTFSDIVKLILLKDQSYLAYMTDR